MATTLTRQALYDLVWSRPRTTLAKELGVSDVAIGKHCAKSHVPAPPMGYWARLSAGGKPRRTPLSMRLPGQADTIMVGADTRHYWRPAGGLEEPLQPPVFAEILDEQVVDACKRLGRVVATRDLNAPDPALARVLASESRRREKLKNGGWSFDKPHFDEPMYQRQLRIFNSLARSLASLYGRQEVRAENEWIQGVGTLHHLALRLNFGDVSMELRFLEPSDKRRDRARKKVLATTLSVGTEQALAGVQDWSDADGRKLEDQLTEIAGQLLRRAEVSLRANAQWQYEQRVKWREEELAAQEVRRQEDEKKRLAAIEAKKAKVRDEIVEIARRRRVAEDIRSTVQALREHPEASGVGRDAFKAWSEHALAIAASIDPMNGSLESILGSFDLPT